MMSREICRACWRVNPIGFHVPDAVWFSCIPPELIGSTLCIMCFIRFADAAYVEWDFSIKFYPVSLVTHNRGEEASANPI